MLSHDGQRVAVDVPSSQTLGDDIWISETSRRTLSRLTFGPESSTDPIWSSDDSRIVFSRQRGTGRDLYLKAAGGTGSEEVLVTSDALKFPTDWSADGRFLAFESLSNKTRTGWDLWVLSIEDRKPVLFLGSEFDESGGRFSPDGRWMAYVSNQSGREEIYVQPFPGPGGRWQISTGGGACPIWRRDGREIFYLAPDMKLMSVEVKTGGTFEAGPPRPLFSPRLKVRPFGRQFDVSADGQRFLINMPVSEEGSPPITLIQNWFVERKR